MLCVVEVVASENESAEIVTTLLKSWGIPYEFISQDDPRWKQRRHEAATMWFLDPEKAEKSTLVLLLKGPVLIRLIADPGEDLLLDLEGLYYRQIY